MDTLNKIISVLLILSSLLFSNATPLAFAAQHAVAIAQDETQNAIKTKKIKHTGRDFEGLLSLSNISQTDTSARKRLPITVQEPEKLDFKADEDIVVTVNNPDHEAFTTKVVDTDGTEVAAEIHQLDNGTTSEIVVVADNQFKPGKYLVEITDQEQHTTTQMFTWGVLAINTDKSMYTPHEQAVLSMAVLDEKGEMVCDAEVTLSITKPDGQVDKLSTKEATIITNDACHQKEFTLKPDYEAFYQLGEPGAYKLALKAVTNAGTYDIEDSVIVKDHVDFDVKRIGSTRIYPPLHYPVNLEITANKDFTGTITETVPDSFTITPSEDADSYDKMNTLYFDKKHNPENVLGMTTGKLVMPFDGPYTISQGFGTELTEPTLRNLYTRYGLGGHDGIDFALPIGTPVYAVDDGAVLHAGDGDYGITIVMQHTWGRTYYGHLSKTEITANKDTTIKKGTLIGYSGNTGESTGPHLHFGMKPDKPDVGNGYMGKVDPLEYLPIVGNQQASTLGLSDVSTMLGAEDAEHIQDVASPSASSSDDTEQEKTEAYTVSDEEIQKEVQLTSSPVIEKVKIIKWHVSLKKGEKTTLSYTYLAPQESPQFYVTGPLKFFDATQTVIFEEARKWQIAADAVGDDWYNKAWEYRKEITLLGDTTNGWCNIATGATCNTNWTARRKITINNSASGTNLTDFPLLVVLNSSRIDYAKTQTNGQDLRFVDADGTTLLSHEIENYDESGSEYVWVKVPQINTGSSDYIWMYYGNAGASDGQSGTNVWDSNYRIVHHMNESGSPYQDATANNKDGSGANAPTATTGKIAGGQNFIRANSDEYTVASPNLPTGNFTYSFWANATTFSGGLPRGVMSSGSSGPDNQHEIAMSFNGTMDVYTNNTYRFNDGGGTSTGTWYYFSYTRSGGNLEIFRDGVSVNTWSSDSTAFTFPCSLVVGNTYWGCGLSNGNFLDSKLDEIRVSAIARSADWIEAEYLSMNDSMNSFGSEETTSSTLSDFPVLVSFSADADLSARAQPDGDDILFTSENGITKLAHEIESYSAGTLLAWVKIPTIAMYSDTKIFIYYGNTGTGSQQSASNVWDTNYRASWHMDENTGTTASDSTSYANDLTLSSASWNGTGKIGPAWNGTAALWMSRADDADFDFVAAGTPTVSMWFKSDSATNPSATQYLLSKSRDNTTQSAGYAIYTKTTGVFCFGIDDDTTWSPDDEACSTTDYYDNTWHHLYATKNGTSSIQIYIDGALAGSDSTLAATGTLDNARTLFLGDRQGVDGGADGNDEFAGDIDQAAISVINRSASWISNEYRNQNSPITFRTVGSEETYIFAATMSEVMRHGKFFDSRGSMQPFAF